MSTAFREQLEKQGTWLFRWRSYLPLLVFPGLLATAQKAGGASGSFAGDPWKVSCMAVSFLGFFLRCIVAGYAPEGTSGRDTRRQRADTLNTSGMYSLMRHPLYFGNFLILLGMALFVRVWWAVVISVLIFWLYYERIIFAEEEYLRRKFGNQFMRWAAETPCFFPRRLRWRKPALPFSFRTVLRREYSGFFAIVASYTFLETAEGLVVEGKAVLDWRVTVFFATGLAVYLVLRTLKKKTRVLHVQGR